MVATAILGAGALGAGASIFGASKQSAAANKAISAQQAMFAQAQQAQQPFIQQGQQAAETLGNLLKPGADMSALLKNIPGFQFLQQITQQGVANQGTTTGLGGNTLLAGANAANQVALGAGWQPIVNSLQGLVNSGAGAAGNLGQQAIQTGANVGGNIVGGANAIAAGGLGAANSLGNSATSAVLLSKLLGQGSPLSLTAPTSMYGSNLGSLGGTGGGLGGFF